VLKLRIPIYFSQLINIIIYTCLALQKSTQLTPFSRFLLNVLSIGIIRIPVSIGAIISTIKTVTLTPSLYNIEKKTFVQTEVLLAAVFLSSCLRFSLDPFLGKNIDKFNTLLTNWIQVDSNNNLYIAELSIVILWSALITICGAYWIPIFWKRMLGISIERNEFVQAMIIVFCCFALIGDLTSPLWMSFVCNGYVPFWIHDAVRTVLVTIYSWKVGKVLTDSDH
jgi:hypothetical protein